MHSTIRDSRVGGERWEARQSEILKFHVRGVNIRKGRKSQKEASENFEKYVGQRVDNFFQHLRKIIKGRNKFAHCRRDYHFIMQNL
jgi:hypothetical protein